MLHLVCLCESELNHLKKETMPPTHIRHSPRRWAIGYERNLKFTFLIVSVTQQQSYSVNLFSFFSLQGNFLRSQGTQQGLKMFNNENKFYGLEGPISHLITFDDENAKKICVIWNEQK